MPRATHCPVQKGAMGTKWQMLVKQVGEDAAWKNWTAYNGFPATFKPSADLKKELGWGQDMSLLDSRNRLISRVNQYNQRNNTSHQVINVQHPNNPGRWNPELNINYLPYSNDKLQELIRKTYKDNTLVYSSDEFTKLQYSPVKPKAPSLFDNPAFQKVDYQFKSAEKILANLSKIKQWEKVVTNPPMIWEKIQKDLQIPKEQLELIKNSEGKTVEEKLTNFLSNYSYTVEINTAKQAPKRFNNEYLDADELIGHLVNGELVERSENSQYYSNLTVPGGANYTENEISTPLITPSIKGHAQFSTDKGIGWFRSDEQITNKVKSEKWIETIQGSEGENINIERRTKDVGGKTRRILEVQSDLFQKGRDKDKLTSDNSVFDLFEDEIKEFEEIGLDKLSDEGKKRYAEIQNHIFVNKENQFLQLLNKDNNWVTFFIKSIIQDSAKKGYEKVLFPSGNTASKVEGHQTLEEFIKVKQDRIDKLNSDVNYFVEKYNPEIHDAWKNKEDFRKYQEELADIEISQLQVEIDNVKQEGLSALAPIFKFYEQQITNILKKNYNVKSITDEYGNTWNEVEIKPEHLQTIAFQKGQSKIQPVINISKGLTAKMGVWHAFITPEQAVELSDGQWNGEAGFYNNGNVYLVNGFIDEDTQVHEFAHPLVRSLMLNNPDVADSLWFQFLEHEEGINILNDVERLYPENFDKDGNPNAAAIEEMLVRAITHEAMKGKKYTGFSKVVKDILKAILDAFHAIFGKEVVDITELKTNTTIKDLAKLMTDDSKIELHRDWYADKNDPSFVRAIEHAVNVANMVGLDFTNVAQEQVQREADQRYEDRVNHLETYFGKRLLNLRYNEVARAFDITPARNKDTVHLNFWQFEYFQHGFNGQRKDDIKAAENSNDLLSKSVYTSLRYTGFTYGEMVDPLKHNFYNEYLIDAEYEKYKKAHALSQKIMAKWPTQQALQNADPAEIKRDITRLERLGTINGGHVLTKLKQVQMTQFILERVKKENQPGITTRERRNRGTAGTNFFNEVLDAVVFGEKIDDIHSISGLFQSYVFFSADGIQLAQQLIEEKKKEARDHFHYAERELKEKFKAIRTSGADINEVIIELPDAAGEMREYFISSKLPHTGYQNDKLVELQKREKAGDAKAIALIDFLKTHYKFMETYGGSDRGDIQTYALPQTGADPIDIFKKYFKVSDPLQGLKHVFYSEAEQEYFLDDIVIKTDRGNMQYAAAKRLVLSDMRKGLFKAAAGALKIKTYRHAASLILDKAKASKDNFAFDVGNNIVVAPKSEPPAGAPFTPNKYRSENIEAILTNYYMGLFYQNALQSNLPSIEYIRDYYGQQHKENLEKLLDNIIRFRVYKDRRTQKVGAKTGMAIEFMTTWSIWRSLGLNYMSMIPNAAAAHGNYFKEYGINGYTSLAHKFFNQVMFGNGKNPFKNITKVYNILHNLEIINTRGHVSLSTSTESLGRLQRILFITTEVVETINQMPFMWYNLDNKYFNDYDDDGILIPGKEGIPAALKLEIERTVMRNNGAYSDASKGAYSYNLEWRTAASLRNWMIAGGTETFGMQKTVTDVEYAGFFTTTFFQIPYQTLIKIKEGKYKSIGDIPAYQRLALTKTLRISMLGVIALYGMTMFDTDDDEDKEILNWIKKAFQSVTTFLNWGDTNFKRGLNTISPTIGVLTDLITFVFTSHQQYKGTSVYGKGESKKGADDGDYKLKRNVVQLLPASTIWKGILKEQVKSEKEKDDGPLMLQPIEPIEPVTMEPISNEDE